MKIAHLALTAVLGASALAFAAHAQPAPVEETVIPRPERVCLYVNQIRNTTAVSDREILFRMDNGRTWKNTLRRSCYGLRMRNGISWNIGGDGRVCSNQQVFYVLDYGTPCFLGDFTPYDPAAEEAKAGG